MSNDSNRRAVVAGILISCMICLALFRDIVPSENNLLPVWLPGLCGWLAAALLIDKIKITQRWQTAAIAATGLLLHYISAERGVPIDVGKAIGINAGLISMIAAVGFLRLVVNPGATNEKLPVGARSYYRTMVGVWLFGSVINISAPILFADRLAQREGLSRLASQSIVRVFTICSGWSPFFGGMAVVVTYVPDVNIGLVILLCLPFSLFGLATVLIEARLRFSRELSVFRGYPVQFSSLWVPVVLAVIVVCLSWLTPDWSVLTHISLGALIVSVFGLMIHKSWIDTLRALRKHITDHVPGMVNELSLFLVAGVLATGLASFLASDLGWLSNGEFGLSQALLLLGAMVLLAIIGVHPVVTVSGATPLVLNLNPDPNVLAVVYLLAWSLGTCSSPMSGTHLVFQGRYEVSSWRAAAGNWLFVGFLYLASVPFLYWITQTIGG